MTLKIYKGPYFLPPGSNNRGLIHEVVGVENTQERTSVISPRTQEKRGFVHSAVAVLKYARKSVAPPFTVWARRKASSTTRHTYIRASRS